MLWHYIGKMSGAGAQPAVDSKPARRSSQSFWLSGAAGNSGYLKPCSIPNAGGSLASGSPWVVYSVAERNGQGLPRGVELLLFQLIRVFNLGRVT